MAFDCWYDVVSYIVRPFSVASRCQCELLMISSNTVPANNGRSERGKPIVVACFEHIPKDPCPCLIQFFLARHIELAHLFSVASAPLKTCFESTTFCSVAPFHHKSNLLRNISGNSAVVRPFAISSRLIFRPAADTPMKRAKNTSALLCCGQYLA